MRKNRRLKKHAVVTMGSTGIVLLIFSLSAALLIYWSLDQRCTTIGREIGKAERTYKALETELRRENTKWEGMTSPSKLDERLTRSGIQMRSQVQDQVVKMSLDGRPMPGLAVQRARARMAKNEMIATTTSLSSGKKQQRIRR